MAVRNFSSTAAQTTLSSSVDGSTTTLTVSATTGFPSVPFILAVDAGAAGQELVLVTNVAGTTLTVTRGYDSTVAVAHDTGAVVAHSHGAIDFREANAHVNATSAHGATGAVQGATDVANTLAARASAAETLTNKNLASATNSFPSSNGSVTNGPKTNAANSTAFRATNVGIINVSFLTTSALVVGDVVMTLPAGFVPLGGVVHFVTLVDTATGAVARAHVNTDRTVVIQNAVGSGVVVRGQIFLPI